jgi:hypothetical protein
MKDEIYSLLKKQADWQKQRKSQPWAEKCRQSVILRRTGNLMREDAAKWNPDRSKSND